MANVMLFYVGAVLFLNGLWLLGHIEDKEINKKDLRLLNKYMQTYAKRSEHLPFSIYANFHGDHDRH